MDYELWIMNDQNYGLWIMNVLIESSSMIRLVKFVAPIHNS